MELLDVKVMLILLALAVSGWAAPFEALDHGCQIDPQSCK